MVAGVQAVAAERGARAVISLSDYAHGDASERVEELRASGAAGLLVASPEGHDLSAGTLERLAATGLPFVLMERRPHDPFASCEFVATDHRQGAFAAVRHLAGLGHTKVGLFTNGSPTAGLVREGHEAAVGRLALEADVPVYDSGRPTMGSAEAAEHYDRFVEECLSGGVRAALVLSDHDAIELMRRLRVRGLRTPDDMALIAYDDEIASLADVPLTAVAPPKHELGEQAARLLLDRLDAPDPDSVPVRRLFLHPRLVVRSSCGAAAGA
ncbi:LacI family DNA-binding transcriptional regulator [Streptomyces sp. NPDC059894]|uniref:LacI family DNA-binding transcriptional regulator n=1 Tax=unclassified Streptomyces TaxID=2593676 RepID=UPI0036493BF2